MAIDLKFSTTIERPVDAVCAVISDICGMPRWAASIKAVRYLSKGPLEAGDHFQVTTEFLGKLRVIDYQVTEYQPCSKLAYRSDGKYPTAITMTMQPRDGGTHLTLEMKAKVPSLVAVAVKSHLRSQTQADLGRLVEMLHAA